MNVYKQVLSLYLPKDMVTEVLIQYGLYSDIILEMLDTDYIFYRLPHIYIMCESLIIK